jgi:hypothetical protein
VEKRSQAALKEVERSMLEPRVEEDTTSSGESSSDKDRSDGEGTMHAEAIAKPLQKRLKDDRESVRKLLRTSARQQLTSLQLVTGRYGNVSKLVRMFLEVLKDPNAPPRVAGGAREHTAAARGGRSRGAVWVGGGDQGAGSGGARTPPGLWGHAKQPSDQDYGCPYC